MKKLCISKKSSSLKMGHCPNYTEAGCGIMYRTN